MQIISNKDINYPFAGLVWLVISLIFYGLCISVNLDGKFWTLLSFISGAIIAFGHITRIPILSRGLLLLNGEEVKKPNGDSVWLTPGMYFTFFVFSISTEEHQDIQKQDVIVPPVNCQDIRGKGITAEANGDWEITSNDKFKVYREEQMEANLITLIRRTIIRICGKLNYKTEILGEDLGDLVMKDVIFNREIDKYGIKFNNLMVDAIATDLAQESLNAYTDELYEKEKNKYPAGHPFTHAEIKDINDKVVVQTKVAKRIITNAAVVGRFDAT